MTEFIPPMGGSYHACLGPCATITDQDDATQYLDAYAKYLAEQNQSTLKDARVLAKKNIGYYAGYYPEESFTRMLKLFKTAHPVFGKHLPTSTRQALQMGYEYAMKHSQNSQP